MNELLAKIIDAHGGTERWNEHEKVDATIVSGGGLFPLKGVPAGFEIRAAVDRKQAAVTLPAKYIAGVPVITTSPRPTGERLTERVSYGQCNFLNGARRAIERGDPLCETVETLFADKLRVPVRFG